MGSVWVGTGNQQFQGNMGGNGNSILLRGTGQNPIVRSFPQDFSHGKFLEDCPLIILIGERYVAHAVIYYGYSTAES